MQWRFALGRRAALAALLAPGFGGAHAAPRADRIVLGQTLDISAGSDGSAARVIDGAKACVGAVNAAGGVHGRAIELITLDGGRDAERHARNARQLVVEHGAIALLNCGGDAACLAVATVARELQVPLVGATSGAREMARGHGRHLFPIRPGPDRQAQALIRQLLAMGITRVALLTEPGGRIDALKPMFGKAGVESTAITVDRSSPASLEAAVQALGATPYQAVVVDVQGDTIEQFAERRLTKRPQWPRVLATLANNSLVTLAGAFPDRMIGFVNVVPHPEGATVLTQELQRQAEKYSSEVAINFEGFEAYITTRVCVEALRRINGKPDAARLMDALESMDRLDLRGFTVSFAAGRESGSDWVDVGIRSRSGNYLK